MSNKIFKLKILLKNIYFLTFYLPACYNGCQETVSGGVCDPCPEYFEGDGSTCTDLRTHCSQMSCFGGCIDHEFGGQCNFCPENYTDRYNNGTFCDEEMISCQMNPCYEGVKCSEEGEYIQCDSCPENMVGDGFDCEFITCSDQPCYPGVNCLPAKMGGFNCGLCPEFMSGNGQSCEFVTCESKPCFEGVECFDISANLTDGFGEYENYETEYSIKQIEHGYVCGDCPLGKKCIIVDDALKHPSS